MPSVSLRSCSLCLLHVPDVLAAVLPCLLSLSPFSARLGGRASKTTNHFKSHVDVLN